MGPEAEVHLCHAGDTCDRQHRPRAPKTRTKAPRGVDGTRGAASSPEPGTDKTERTAQPEESQAIGRKLVRYRAFVLGVVRRLGVPWHDCEDAAQEVFLHAFRAWEGYDPGQAIEAWLRAIARRVAANWRRGIRRRPTRPWLPEHDDHEVAIGSEDRLEARSVLRAMPDAMKPLLEAMLVEGNIADAARSIGVKDDTAQGWIQALRQGRTVRRYRRKK